MVTPNAPPPDDDVTRGAVWGVSFTVHHDGRGSALVRPQQPTANSLQYKQIQACSSISNSKITDTTTNVGDEQLILLLSLLKNHEHLFKIKGQKLDDKNVLLCKKIVTFLYGAGNYFYVTL